MGNGSRFLAGPILLFLWAAFLSGQGMNARIIGTVVDEDGAYLSGVVVTVIDVNSNAERTVMTENQEGRFRLLALPPGIYQVSFELDGYISYVASGIRLYAEQSVNLRIKLRKTESFKNAKIISANPETGSPEDDEVNQEIVLPKGRFSIHFSAGMNYLAVGDCNSYLTSFYRIFRSVHKRFETFNSGVDLNAEIGYRISPRLEIAAGLGLVQDQMRNNVAAGYTYTTGWNIQAFRIGFSVKTLPLQFVLRYWLGTSGVFSYAIQGGILFNFATWKMYRENNMNQNASARGLGFAVGGHGELKMDENVSFIIDLSGRYAPVQNFSGLRNIYKTSYTDSGVQRGQVWFFEYYDSALGMWIWNLGIGGRPVGPGTRNVSSAKVDFSGLALKIGLLVRF
jgi:hypothetical protein